MVPYNVCVLAEFPTTLAKNATTAFPFGLWFANPDTLYVADEGDGAATYAPRPTPTPTRPGGLAAGLQKWTFNATAGECSSHTRCTGG